MSEPIARLKEDIARAAAIHDLTDGIEEHINNPDKHTFSSRGCVLCANQRLTLDLDITRAERDQAQEHYQDLKDLMQGSPKAKAALEVMTRARDQLARELARAQEEAARDEERWEECVGELNERVIALTKRLHAVQKILDKIRRSTEWVGLEISGLASTGLKIIDSLDQPE